MVNTATLKNITRIDKTDRAWLIAINGGTKWVPYSVIKAFNPGQRTINIDTWWLIKEGIEFTV